MKKRFGKKATEIIKYFESLRLEEIPYHKPDFRFFYDRKHKFYYFVKANGQVFKNEKAVLGNATETGFNL